MPNKAQNIVVSLAGSAPDIGRWLWALEDARARTNAMLAGLDPALIDWISPHDDSSLGTILYHVALIETDWLYAEVLEQPYPPPVAALLPHDHRTADGRLTNVCGVSFAEHLARLATVRGLLLDVFQSMSAADFRRVRHLPAYDVTPEWVLHHLLQHEAEHRSQMGAIRSAAERAAAVRSRA